MTMLLSYHRPSTKRRILNGEKITWIDNDSKRRKRDVYKIICSYPYWQSKKELKELVNKCKRKTLKTGKIYVIDHIIPLNGENVSGLTCTNNLRIILKEENEKKSNKVRNYGRERKR